MKKLNVDILQAGDIILTSAVTPTSKVIRTATQSDVSHAILCVEPHSVIDASMDGVHARNPQRMFFEDSCSVYVLRLRNQPSREQIDSITLHIRSCIGAEYSIAQAILTPVLRSKGKWNRQQFCSRLVAQSFQAAGIFIVGNPDYCSPKDIRNSALLYQIQNTTLPISEEELKFWKNNPDSTISMREAINQILAGARKKSKHIQDLGDIDTHLITHPEDDKYFCDLIEKTGYLTVWKKEFYKNPWQYSISLIMKEDERGLEKYCRDLIASNASGPDRFIINRGQYVQLCHHYSNINYFEKMLDLYEKLSSLHNMRLKAARWWMESKGYIEQAPKKFLPPHSEEWFASLELWNPIQAKIARIAIEHAQNLNVCSICADDEIVHDYYVDPLYQTYGGPNTIRLCNDCFIIRKNSGDRFVRL